MEIKAGEFRNIKSGLDEILEIGLPVKTSYWLSRISNKIDSEIESYEKVRINLAIKLSKKDENGEPILISTYDKIVRVLTEQSKNDDVTLKNAINKLDEQEKTNGGQAKLTKQYDVDEGAFQKEFNQLLEEKIEIDFKPIKLADLEGETCEKCGKKKGEIKGSILAKLGNIIEE